MLDNGGTASNAIRPKAKAVKVVDSADKVRVEQKAATWLAELQKEYEGIEDSMSCTMMRPMHGTSPCTRT